MGRKEMEHALEVMRILTIALGAGLTIWGEMILDKGYEEDDPEMKEQGIRQMFAGMKIGIIGEMIPSVNLCLEVSAGD